METGQWLSRLTNKQRIELLSLGTLKHYSKDEVIVHQGDRTNTIFICLKGLCQSRTSGLQETESLHCSFHENSLLVPCSIFGLGFYACTIVADGSTEILRLSRERFLTFLAKHPRLLFCQFESISNTSQALHEQINLLKVRRIYDRILSFFILNKDNRAITVICATQSNMAMYLGCSREEVSRAIKTLLRKRYIESHPQSPYFRVTAEGLLYAKSSNLSRPDEHNDSVDCNDSNETRREYQ